MNAPLRFITGLTFLVLTSCGGEDLASGGIGGTGISFGTVTGFGSVFVNGVEWELSGATIEIDDQPGSESDLALGMVVKVEGTFSASQPTGTATRVEFSAELEGPIEAVRDIGNDGLIKEIDILGRTVVVEKASTRFDNSNLTVKAFEELDPTDVNKVFEVSGFVDPNGKVRATHLEEKGTVQFGTTEVELKGQAGNVAGTTFTIGGITINMDGSTDVSDLPGGIVTNGMNVEVKGVLQNATTVLATKVEPEDDFGDNLDDAEVEGIISNFVGLSSFMVAGQAVDASQATLEPNDASLFGNGAKVEVEGPIVNGVLIAEELKLRGEDVKIEAEVANAANDVDVNAKTITMLGNMMLGNITVVVNSATLMEDDLHDLPMFGLADIRDGDFLEIRGFEDASGRVIATRIERDDEDDVILQARIKAGGCDAGAGTITLLGVVVPTNGATEFEDTNDQQLGNGTIGDFCNAVQAGDLVKVKDDKNDNDATTIDVADEVDLES